MAAPQGNLPLLPPLFSLLPPLVDLPQVVVVVLPLLPLQHHITVDVRISRCLVKRIPPISFEKNQEYIL